MRGNRLVVQVSQRRAGLRLELCGSRNTVPSGKRLHNYGKSQCLMGKSTISMAIFNSYVCLPEGISIKNMWTHNQRCYIPMFATSIPMVGDYVSTFGGYDIPILGDHIPILLVVTSQSLAIMCPFVLVKSALLVLASQVLLAIYV